MRKTYTYHKPSEQGIVNIQSIREGFDNLHTLLEQAAPHSRELSVALTHLETAAMWATKAVVVNDAGSTQPDDAGKA